MPFWFILIAALTAAPLLASVPAHAELIRVSWGGYIYLGHRGDIPIIQAQCPDMSCVNPTVETYEAFFEYDPLQMVETFQTNSVYEYSGPAYLDLQFATGHIAFETTDAALSLNIYPWTWIDFSMQDAGTGDYFWVADYGVGPLSSVNPLDMNFPSTIPITSAGRGEIGDTDILGFNSTFGVSAQIIAGSLPEIYQVPEPAAMTLLGAGLVGLGAIRRRGVA